MQRETYFLDPNSDVPRPGERASRRPGPAVVESILSSDVVTFTPGLRLRSSDIPDAAGVLPPWEDYSEILVGGKVDWNSTASGSFTTCTLRLAEKLPWGRVQAQPYIIATDGDRSIIMSAGVFMLTTPTLRVSDEEEDDLLTVEFRRFYDRLGIQQELRIDQRFVYEVTGYDRRYKLDRPVGDNWEVREGASYRTEIDRVVRAAGISTGLSVLTDELIGADQAWWLQAQDGPDASIDTTWLEIIDTLLKGANHGRIWFDEEGEANSSREPADERASLGDPEWIFDARDKFTTTVGSERQSEQDTWGIPNAWIFVSNSGDADPYFDPPLGTPEITTSANTGMTSIANLGYRRYRNRSLPPPPADSGLDNDQEYFLKEAKKLIAEDLRASWTITITTSAIPLVGHRDRYQYEDPQISPFPLQVRSRSYSLDLLGADMSHTLEVITP